VEPALLLMPVPLVPSEPLVLLPVLDEAYEYIVDVDVPLAADVPGPVDDESPFDDVDDGLLLVD
jgi:hypothetical protein